MFAPGFDYSSSLSKQELLETIKKASEILSYWMYIFGLYVWCKCCKYVNKSHLQAIESGANMDEMMQGFIEVPRTEVSIKMKKFAGKFTSRAAQRQVSERRYLISRHLGLWM